MKNFDAVFVVVVAFDAVVVVDVVVDVNVDRFIYHHAL